MSVPVIFDRAAYRRHLARARPRLAAHDALPRAVAAELGERLAAVKRDFSVALDLGPFPFLAGLPRIVAANDIVCDEELLPFAPQSFDLIACNLALHWVNDLPGALAQLRACLKPGGFFIAALVGGNSLPELRTALLAAELAVSGGVSPRLSPTVDLLTASQLLQRAGFALPVADVETVTLLYPDAFALMRELRGLGQTNAHAGRPRRATRRAVFFEAARLYQAQFADAAGAVPATLEIIHLHGWA